ncbi:hypothetical protein GCM10027040_11020 [Halomonas shantousis]
MNMFLVKPAASDDPAEAQSPKWWVVDTRNASEEIVVASFDSEADAANEAARLNSLIV